MQVTDIETPAQEFFKIQEIGVLIANLVNLALVVAAILTFAYLMWGAFDWIMSEGDKTKYEQARNKITFALMGLAITAVVWVVWQLALYFLGIGEVVGGQVILRLFSPAE